MCIISGISCWSEGAVIPSRNDAGNTDYEAHEVDGQPGIFLIYERWETREHLDAHLSAPRMQDLVPQMLDLIDGSKGDFIRSMLHRRFVSAGIGVNASEPRYWNHV
jgi:hypothetical protein